MRSPELMRNGFIHINRLEVCRVSVPERWPLAVKFNGDGTAMREFTHVRDVAQAFRLALEATTPGQELTYNVATGRGVSVHDVIGVVRSVTGRPVPAEHGPPRDEPRALVADSSRISRDLGWNAVESDLETMVRDAWSAIS